MIPWRTRSESSLGLLKNEMNKTSLIKCQLLHSITISQGTHLHAAEI